MNSSMVYSMSQAILKTVRQYTAIFELDEERGGYTVTIPALPGCISEGDTFELALKNIEEAASLYLEVLKEKQEELPAAERFIIAPIQITA